MTAQLYRLHALPLLAVVIWGGVYPGAKFGLMEIPALSFTALRLVLASAVLFTLVHWSRRPSAGRSLWLSALVPGLAQAMFQLFFVLSMLWTTAGNGAILLATAPLMVAIWQAVRHGRPGKGAVWLGLVLGLLGVLLVVTGSGSISFSGDHLLGSVCALLSAAAWAWYGITAGRVVGVFGSVAATAMSLGIASVLLLPVSIGEISAFPWSSVSWIGWSALLYGSLAGPVLAMTLWGYALHRLGPEQTMIYTYLEPIAAVIIAAWLLGESFGAIQALGAVLTLVGVWLATTKAKNDKDQAIQSRSRL